MDKKFFNITLFLLLITSLASCSVIGDIFQVGMGAGIFLVIIVIAAIVYLFSKMGRNK